MGANDLAYLGPLIDHSQVRPGVNKYRPGYTDDWTDFRISIFMRYDCALGEGNLKLSRQ